VEIYLSQIEYFIQQIQMNYRTASTVKMSCGFQNGLIKTVPFLAVPTAIGARASVRLN